MENFCGNCNARNKPGEVFWVHSTYIWANQYGRKKRFFCHWCGNVWEDTEMEGYSKHQVLAPMARIYDDSKWPNSSFPN